jgi:hypothetical protein
VAFGVRLRPVKAGLRRNRFRLRQGYGATGFGVWRFQDLGDQRLRECKRFFSGSYTMRAPCDGSVKIGEQVAPVSSW